MDTPAQDSPEAKAQDEPIFSVVQPQRVSQIIEKQLREAIISHHYRAGDKLPPERELAKIFGASRSSIREAIRSLEKSGFVIVKKGVQGGAYVLKKGDTRKITHHLRDVLRLRDVSLENVLQARLIIEPEVAAKAAENASSEGIRLLEEITKEQLESFDPQNPVTKFDRNPRFHRILAEMTGNQVLMIIQEILMEIHSHSMNKKKMNQKTIQRITSQHQGIINALKKKDSKLAYERVKKHVMSVHEMHERLEDLNH
jgi:GntR family transcriptional repressor for pyruvate dehydrogenase complex